MGDEDQVKADEGQAAPAGTPRPEGEGAGVAAMVEGGRDATTGEGPAPYATAPAGGSVLEAGGPKGAGGRWSVGKNVLIGVGVGALIVLLIGGIFVAGYCVGRQDGECGRGVPSRRTPPREPTQPGLPSAPPPGPMGAAPGRLDILVEYRDEIEGEVAAKLGISVADLRKEIESGKTMAEIGEEKGVPAEDLTAAVAARISEIADRMVAEGEMTSRQAESVKSDAEVMAKRWIERGYRRVPVPSE